MATKYYAVKKGLSTGVFFTWDECKKMVDGYPGAIYKSFPTFEEAEAFVKGETYLKPAAGATNGAAANVAATRKSANAEVIYEAGALTAYVDGSYNVATEEFSYGMVLLAEGLEETYCEKYADAELASMRNVAGEIKGAEAAMRYAVEKGYRKLYIYHDYEGIAKWCQGLWKTNKEGTIAYKAYFDSIQDKIEVVFKKVAAHTGNTYNEMADKLAKKALGIE